MARHVFVTDGCWGKPAASKLTTVATCNTVRRALCSRARPHLHSAHVCPRLCRLCELSAPPQRRGACVGAGAVMGL